MPTTTAPGITTGPNALVTLASEFFEHDYVNVYAFGNGVLDSNNPIVTSTGQVRNTLGTGFAVGGGVSLSHGFSDAQLNLSYQGSYQDYQSGYFTSGSTQYLALNYAKRLSRHLSMNVSVGAGNFLYGGTFYSSEPAGAVSPVITNPLSPQTRYLNAGVSLTYRQTRRLSYSVFGNFFLDRYNYAGAIGTTGASGGGSVNYQWDPRTSFSLSYIHSYFDYQRGAGNGFTDQIGLGGTHVFRNHWSASGYIGGARTDASGVIAVPVTLLVGNEAVGGYVLGAYKQVAFVPSFSGSVSHSLRRRSVFSVGAGEGIAGSGNGYFLASRNIYVNGVFSYSWQGQNISLGGGAYKLSSIANSVSSSYSSASFSASYGRGLIRHVGMFLRYDYIFYGSLAPYNGNSDNRLSFGFNFSSRSVPMTLF